MSELFPVKCSCGHSERQHILGICIMCNCKAGPGWKKPVPAPAESVDGETKQREDYYLDILRRIATGWSTPQSLAQMAIEHDWEDEEPAPAVAAPAEGKPMCWHKEINDEGICQACGVKAAIKLPFTPEEFRERLRSSESKSVDMPGISGKNSPSFEEGPAKFVQAAKQRKLVRRLKAMPVDDFWRLYYKDDPNFPPSDAACKFAIAYAAHLSGFAIAASTPPPAATVSRDLEGKLRELRNTMVDWTHCTPPFATNVVCEAAALGRAEGLEDAAEYVLSVRETGKMENAVQVFDVLARAIRALKNSKGEKG